MKVPDAFKDQGYVLGSKGQEAYNDQKHVEKQSDVTSPDHIDHSENPLDSNKGRDKNDQNPNRKGNFDPTVPANPAYRKHR